MGNQEVQQVVPGDHNIFTGIGDIHINYGLPPVEASERRVLLQLVDSLKSFWIDTFLKDSLHGEAILELGKELVPDMVCHPWGRVLELPGKAPQPLPQTKSIGEIFSDTGRALLILGEPGAGKTVTLVELAKELIAQFETNVLAAVPVILNLSRWQKDDMLATWIETELESKYFVLSRHSRVWLESSRLILLLDGLDEVPAGNRTSCVRAINDFARNFGLPGIAVCSRRTEYIALPERLKFTGAVCLQPLTLEQVDYYLKKFETQLAPLQRAIKEDKDLAELTRTPLMLSVMSLAFQGTVGDELARHKGGSLEERRKQIFSRYIEKMFQRKGTAPLAFPKDKTIGWLSWLARMMGEQSQSVFLLEELQPSWLGTRAQRVTYKTVVLLSLGLLFGLIGGSMGGLFGGSIARLIAGSAAARFDAWMGGLIGGLYCGLAGVFFGLSEGRWRKAPAALSGRPSSIDCIALVETLSWNWKQSWETAIRELRKWRFLFLSWGFMFGLMAWGKYRLIYGLTYGPIAALTSALAVGLSAGLVGGFTHRFKVGKAFPNQGIKLSAKNSLIVFLVSLPIGVVGIGSFIGFISGLAVGPIPGLIYPLIFGLVLGLLGGLVTALPFGGSAVIKHYALRLTLWLSGYTPFNFVKFLDHCARLILLKKVGGGYIFIHRMLLDYFAELTPESTRTGDKTTS